MKDSTTGIVNNYKKTRKYNNCKGNIRRHYFFYTLFFMIMVNGTMSGQVSASYTFSSTADTYTPLSSSTTLFSTNWDEGVSSLISIPFSFTYNGASYNSCYVSTNGFITFGSAPGTSNYIPISNTTNPNTYSGAISAFGRDLASSTTGNNIVYGTEGSGSNRTFVIQWINAQRYYNNSSVINYSFYAAIVP